MFGWRNRNPFDAFVAALETTRQQDCGMMACSAVLFSNFVAEFSPRLQLVHVSGVQCSKVVLGFNRCELPLEKAGLSNF
jgi:hypothetical protein